MATMADKTEERLIESGKYYDVLYDFTKTMYRINDKAADGEVPKALQASCVKLLPAFALLCGGAEQPKAKPKPKPKTVLQVNLRVMDGWGVCPTCGKKCIKVQNDTILVNYPMFCKVCKRDYVVTWKMDP